MMARNARPRPASARLTYVGAPLRPELAYQRVVGS